MIEVKKNSETGRPHTFRFLDNAVSFSLCFWVDAHVVNGAAFQLKGSRRRGKKSLLLAFPAPPYHLPFSLLFWLDTGQVSTGCFAFVGCTVLQFLPALGSEPDGGVPSALELTCCLKPPHTGTRQYWGLTFIFSWPAFLLLSHWIVLFSPGFSVANKEGLQKGTCVWPIISILTWNVYFLIVFLALHSNNLSWKDLYTQLCGLSIVL